MILAMMKTRKATKAAGKAHREGLAVIQLFKLFPDDKVAEQWFEKQRWPNGRCCPDCGSLNTSESKDRKPMPYRCRDCRKHFSVRKGTSMQSSKLGYQKWVVGLYLMSTSLKGISSMKAYRELGITQKTAWYLTQRIREGFFASPTSMTGPVEMDETFVGGKRRNMPKSKRANMKGRGAVGKTAVVGIKDRKTKRVSAKVVSDTKGETLLNFVLETVVPGTEVYTDESTSYSAMGGFEHESVNHSHLEYVRGQVHTNGIESLWSMLKRGYVGTYHQMSAKHVHRYVREFAGRQNIREFDTLTQMALIAKGLDGKLLHYRDLIAE